jgi:hypothetical protein
MSVLVVESYRRPIATPAHEYKETLKSEKNVGEREPGDGRLVWL